FIDLETATHRDGGNHALHHEPICLGLPVGSFAWVCLGTQKTSGTLAHTVTSGPVSFLLPNSTDNEGVQANCGGIAIGRSLGRVSLLAFVLFLPRPVGPEAVAPRIPSV